MLVLSRKVGDELIIDNQITITVTKVSGNRVTLGIKAPPEVRVLRGELEEFQILPNSVQGPNSAQGEEKPSSEAPSYTI